jgi:NAD(P)-dependent dehydrogenase (short-subunit alcohol dehydrogenase family)
MLLQGKNAVIHGGGGAIGGAVARAFAREGARVHLAGRRRHGGRRAQARVELRHSQYGTSPGSSPTWPRSWTPA